MPDEPKGNELAGLPPVSKVPWVPLPSHKWTEPERWVWEQVRTGRVANFNKRYGKALDPKNEELWNKKEVKQRGLRPDFLRTILLSQPWRGLITHGGVRIKGARFLGQVYLSNCEVNCELWLDASLLPAGMGCSNTVFKYNLSLRRSNLDHQLTMDGASVKGDLFMSQGKFKDARLLGVQVGGAISMEGAEFEGELAVDGASITGDLFMTKGKFKDVSLLGVQVGGQLAMTEAEFQGELAMDRAEVQASLFMTKGEFKSARLHGVKIGGQLVMNGAEFEEEVFLPGASVGGELGMVEAVFKKELSMDRASVKGALFMNEGLFKSARLHGIQVDGPLVMTEAEFQGELAMDRASVAASLFMDEGKFKSVRLDGVQVGGQLAMVGSVFDKSVSMERLRVKGDLYLRNTTFKESLGLCSARIGGHIFCEGAEFASIDLEDTSCDTIYDGRTKREEGDNWPNGLRLDRFTYNHIRGVPEQDDTMDLADRKPKWFKEWLAKQKKFSPQPYQQCAKVLREAGQPDKANAVLYIGRERERWEPDGRYGRWLFLTGSKLFLGHCLGKRFFWFPAGWAFALWLAGVFVCHEAPTAAAHSWYWCMGYSLNRLIPLVDLHPSFKLATQLGFGPSAWFMLQTLCGWFLAALVIAGLAGVGKPGGRES